MYAGTYRPKIQITPIETDACPWILGKPNLPTALS